jgi:hypothetical protein
MLYSRVGARAGAGAAGAGAASKFSSGAGAAPQHCSKVLNRLNNIVNRSMINRNKKNTVLRIRTMMSGSGSDF